MNGTFNGKTIIGRTNENALYKDLTPQEILDFLEHEALFRGFSNMISKVFPHEDAEKILVKRHK